MPPPCLIQSFQAAHSVEEITTLLHQAYAPLALAGMRYLASHQDAAMTRQRLLKGQSFVATDPLGKIIGTISVYPPKPESPCRWYRQDGHFSFGQFAVLPEFQGQGIGRAVLEKAIAVAHDAGAIELGLDTAEKADELIAWYQRLGFRLVETVEWEVTNYRSVVLSLGVTNGG